EGGKGGAGGAVLKALGRVAGGEGEVTELERPTAAAEDALGAEVGGTDAGAEVDGEDLARAPDGAGGALAEKLEDDVALEGDREAEGGGEAGGEADAVEFGDVGSMEHGVAV